MRIAIVNDVILAVEAMRRVVLSSGSHQVAWTAVTGAEAVEFCVRDTPDLILMDLILPGKDGVQATREIMGRCPCAILVVTANVTNNCSKVFEAMGAGALDAVNTPVLEWPGSCKGAADLLAKIEIIRKLLGAKASSDRAPARHFQSSAVRPYGRLIVIGASAGGPAALSRIISYLPASFGSPLVVVQHVDPQFAPGLANWLDDQSPLRVRLAREGDCPASGTILLAGGDRHLVFAGPRRLSYTDEPADCSYRPSVDVFFKSVRQNWHGNVTAVLLTGMGRDGARELLALRQAGHHTVTQDQASSAVYGMPKAAAELHAAAEILSLEQIGVRLRTLGMEKIAAHA